MSKAYITLATTDLLTSTHFSVAATPVYSEDFAITSSLPMTTQAYIGGWFGNLATFDTIAVASQTSINTTDEVLEVTNTTSNNFRGIGIVLDPNTVGAAGSYTVSFDITTFDGDSLDYAQVSVWEGSGYAASSGNALLLNAETGTLQTTGSAISSNLATEDYTSTGSGLTLDFNYDGTSVVAIFLGSYSQGFPHPTIDFDNIQVSTVPEPSSAVYLALLTGMIVLKRKR